MLTYRKYELATMITQLANEWLDIRMAAHDYNDDMKEMELEQFFNLSLRTVFGLVDSGLMPELPETHPLFTNWQEITRLLQNSVSSIAEAVEEAAGTQQIIVEINSEKTNLQRWLQQKEREVTVSTRLRNVLLDISLELHYMEDINKKNFFRYRNCGPKTWNEFVQLRGW